MAPSGRSGGPLHARPGACHGGGAQLATGDGRPCCGGGSLQLWQVGEYVPAQLLRGFDLVVRDLDFSPDGSTLAMALVGLSDIWLMDASTGVAVEVIEGHAFRVNSVGYSPDGALLASGSNDTRIGLWDASDGTFLQALDEHRLAVNSVSFAPDGTRLVSRSQDGQIVLLGLP